MTKLNVAEINERIEAKLRDLKGGRAETERAHKIVSKVDARVDELRDELKQTRRTLDHRRRLVKEVREDLHVAELEEIERLRAATGEVPEGLVEGNADVSDEQISRLGSRLDNLSGLIEEGFATRDRLIDRLDRLRERETEAERVLDEVINERDEDREALKRMRARRQKIKDRMDAPPPISPMLNLTAGTGRTSLMRPSPPSKTGASGSANPSASISGRSTSTRRTGPLNTTRRWAVSRTRSTSTIIPGATLAPSLPISRARPGLRRSGTPSLRARLTVAGSTRPSIMLTLVAGSAGRTPPGRGRYAPTHRLNTSDGPPTKNTGHEPGAEVLELFYRRAQMLPSR